MPANLNGVIFDQIYGDNSGGAEFDTDNDGTTSQEDEFVSFTNTTGAPVDISGWEIWSDSAGFGAPDTAMDGRFHIFPPGTTLAAGETLYVVNEITGPPRDWAQEASEGGVESGAGGTSTNFLSEGNGDSSTDGIALVDPVSGDYIVFNMSSSAENISSLPGFPGTSNIGEVNGNAVNADQNAGTAYRYNSGTDSYQAQAVSVPCFAAGTRVAVPGGACAVEDLTEGDLVDTLDHGPQPVRAILRRTLDFRAGADPRHKPIEFKPCALGDGRPARRLVVSPQHRVLLTNATGQQVLVSAKGLTDQPGVRVMQGRQRVDYVQLVFDRHEILMSEGALTESFFPGAYVVATSDLQTKSALFRIFPGLLRGQRPKPARSLMRVDEARALARIA